MIPPTLYQILGSVGWSREISGWLVGKLRPQRLKPLVVKAGYGTAEAVP
jgi:hypothetical protein